MNAAKVHINLAKSLMKRGRYDQAQVEAILGLADHLTELANQLEELKDSFNYQISNLAERVEKCLVLNKVGEEK